MGEPFGDFQRLVDVYVELLDEFAVEDVRQLLLLGYL